MTTWSVSVQVSQVSTFSGVCPFPRGAGGLNVGCVTIIGIVRSSLPLHPRCVARLLAMLDNLIEHNTRLSSIVFLHCAQTFNNSSLQYDIITNELVSITDE